MRQIIILLAISGVMVFGQTDYRFLYFDWTSIPAYTNYASTDLLEPGHGEIGFATSNFCIWGFDTTGYDNRTVDLLFRIGVIPHMEFGIKYSSPKAVVLDLRGGFELGDFDFTGSAGFGYTKATMHVVRNLTFWLFDGYPTVSVGYEIFPWLRAVVSGKGILSHYVLEKVATPENFTTFNIGYTLMLDIGTELWRVRPEVNRYWGVTDYTLFDEDVHFHNHSFGIGALYRPSFKKD